MSRTYDVVIIGAGSAGAAAATACARQGMTVALLEAGPLARAGARWINAIPGWTFDEAEVARPTAEETLGPPPPAIHLYAGHRQEHTKVVTDEFIEVDMGLLVARLQREARSAGATLMPASRVVAARDETLELEGGGEVKARWFVDASGLGGARLLGQGPLAPADICEARHQVHQVNDMDRARAYFAGYGVAPGESLVFTSVAGGFSSLQVRLEGEVITLLSGTIPGQGWDRPRKVLSQLCREQPWIGEQLRGAGRAIPLRRPYDELVRGNRAAMGDAACQVFSAHGSGVGQGLIAGKILADALASGRGLLGYQADYQRSHGGVLAAMVWFRRLTQRLTPLQLGELMRSGVMNPEISRDALLQRSLDDPPSAAALASIALGIGRQPRLALKVLLKVLGPTVARMGLIRQGYRAYPASGDAEDLTRWQGRMRLLGQQPDPISRSQDE